MRQPGSPPRQLHGISASDLLRSTFLWLLLVGLVVLTGCAQLAPAPPARTADQDHWSGRLALQTEGQEHPSFSAGFDLRGSPLQGELALSGPLGQVLARLQWEPGRALLVSGHQTRMADSLDLLLEQSTGAQLPIAAMFDWLNGIATTVDGWQADLSRLDQGRLSATRHHLQPRATLRIVLDR